MEFKYAQQNAHFFIFDSHNGGKLLEHWFIEQLLETIEKTTKQMKWEKAYMHNSNGMDNNCPIILSNLTFGFLVIIYSQGGGTDGRKQDQQPFNVICSL